MSILDELNERGAGTLPGLIGLEIMEAEEGAISGRLDLRDELMAPNGYLHAATVIALADTSCGYGTFVNLPEGAESFWTYLPDRWRGSDETPRPVGWGLEDFNDPPDSVPT